MINSLILQLGKCLRHFYNEIEITKIEHSVAVPILIIYPMSCEGK